MLVDTIYDDLRAGCPHLAAKPQTIDIVLRFHFGRSARGGHSLGSSLFRDLRSSGFFAEVARKDPLRATEGGSFRAIHPPLAGHIRVSGADLLRPCRRVNSFGARALKRLASLASHCYGSRMFEMRFAITKVTNT